MMVKNLVKTRSITYCHDIFNWLQPRSPIGPSLSGYAYSNGLTKRSTCRQGKHRFLCATSRQFLVVQNWMKMKLIVSMLLVDPPTSMCVYAVDEL